MMNKIKHVMVLCCSAFLVACSFSGNYPLYYWGNYSYIVYDYYNGEGDLNKHEEALLNIIRRANDLDLQVAPGIYAHLGMVRLKLGRGAEAQAAFLQEQQLYPESERFIQYLQRKK